MGSEESLAMQTDILVGITTIQIQNTAVESLTYGEDFWNSESPSASISGVIDGVMDQDIVPSQLREQEYI